MIAVAVIAIALVSVYRLHAQTISMATAVRFYTSAPLLAQSAMSEIEMKSSNDLASDSGAFGEKFQGYTWTATVDDIESELLGEIAEHLKQVDLTVNFNDGGFVYKLRTYRLVSEE
jgi:general secretion pathway protein I